MQTFFVAVTCAFSDAFCCFPQVIWLGTWYQLCKVMAQTLPNATVQFSAVVSDLGVLIDSELTMANHIMLL